MEIKEIAPIEIGYFFESLNDKEIANKSLLTEFILKQVGVGFRGKDFDIKRGEYLESKGMKIKIWPDELAAFLIFLYEHKTEINSYVEFGTGGGGTFFIIDSYLRTINPNMENSVTIDMRKRAPRGLDAYKTKYTKSEFIQMKTKDFPTNQKYDLCFLDAEHSYGDARKDYVKMKNCCKFIAFHDIQTISRHYPNEMCVRHLWGEISADHKISIVTDDPRISFMSGIGVVWND